MANAVEFVPDQAKTEAVEAHVIWMTTGLSCDGHQAFLQGAGVRQEAGRCSAQQLHEEMRDGCAEGL